MVVRNSVVERIHLSSGGVTTLNGESGAVTLTSSGNTVTITTPSAHVINLEAVGDGTGDVHGPASSTDNAITRYDGTTGKIIQNSIPTIDDDGNVNLHTGSLNMNTGVTGGGNIQMAGGSIQMPADSLITDNTYTVLDPSGRILYAPGVVQMIDFSNTGYNSSSAMSFTNGSAIFKSIIRDSDTNASIATNDRLLYDPNANVIIDFSDNGYNSSASISFETQKAKFSLPITDHSNNDSIETDTRELFASSSAIMLDWSNAGFNSSAAISFAAQKAIFLSSIADHGGNSSIDTDNRYLYVDPTQGVAVILDYTGLTTNGILNFSWTNQAVVMNGHSIFMKDGALAGGGGDIRMDGGAILDALNVATDAISIANASSITFNNSFNIVGGSFILDAAGGQSIDTNNRFLYDASNLQSLDWTIRSTLDTGNVESINWQSRNLFDGSHNQSVNWSSRYLFDSANGGAVDWENRWLFYSASAGGNASLVWEVGQAHAQDSSLSIDWNSRQLKDPSSNVVIDYTHSINNSAPLSFSSNAAIFEVAIRDSANNPAINTSGRLLYATDGSSIFMDWTGTYNSGAAISSDSGTIAFTGNTSYHASYIQDASNIPSISPGNRQLLATDGTTVTADWANATLGDVLNWSESGYDSGFAISFEAQCAIFKNTINDHTNKPSIDTDGRLLYGADGTTVVIDYNSVSAAQASLQVPIGGSYTTTGTATTTFTVTLPSTQPSSLYQVAIEPTNLLSTALQYVDNKTTTTFDVTYLTGLTGAVAFDWILVPQLP